MHFLPSYSKNIMSILLESIFFLYYLFNILTRKKSMCVCWVHGHYDNIYKCLGWTIGHYVTRLLPQGVGKIYTYFNNKVTYTSKK